MKEEILENIQLLEEEGKDLNEAQKKYLREQHNAYLKFRYAEGHLCVAFETTESDFSKMEYYLGLEYAREDQEMLLKVNKKVIVVYGLCDRITELLDALQELEEK